MELELAGTVIVDLFAGPGGLDEGDAVPPLLAAAILRPLLATAAEAAA